MESNPVIILHILFVVEKVCPVIFFLVKRKNWEYNLVHCFCSALGQAGLMAPDSGACSIWGMGVKHTLNMHTHCLHSLRN